jgi:hypothetical protein
LRNYKLEAGLGKNHVIESKTKGETCCTRFVAHCRVSYKDIEFIGHAVNVEADSLQEAVAKAVQVFRTKLWDGCPPGSGCEMTVEVYQTVSTIYKVMLYQAMGRAKSCVVCSPAERIKQLLGILETDL